MTEDIVLSNQVPEGWNRYIDKSGEEQSVRLALEVGDLSKLLRKSLGERWRFNQLSKKIELDGKPVPVHELENLYCHLSERGYKIAKDKAIDAAKAAAMSNAFHPVKEYLDQIGDDDTIPPADLERVGTHYWETSDELYNSMIRKALLGAVKRVYEPGCMFRTCLVFKGPQDIGKSTGIRILANPEWLTDTAQDKHEDFLLAIHSCWIYELAELDSITSKKEAGALKNNLSSPKYTIRVPYGRSHETFQRSSIFWGTSNRADFLRDDTGHSRFLVVELPHDADTGHVINLARIREDRDAIWRAAVLAYRSGEQPVLSAKQQADSNRRNRRYEQDHPWEDYIGSWIEDVERDLPHVEEFTSEQALYMSGAVGQSESANGWGYQYPALKQKDAVEVGRILRRLGFVQDTNAVRRNGEGRRRYWRRPDTAGTS